MLRKGDKQRAETVYVVKGQGDVALLSRQAVEDMGLMKYHIEATTAMSLLLTEENRLEVGEIVQEYKDVFRGIGNLKGVKVKLYHGK